MSHVRNRDLSLAKKSFGNIGARLPFSVVEILFPKPSTTAVQRRCSWPQFECQKITLSGSLVMTSIYSLLSTLSPDLQPTKEEVQRYAQAITHSEGLSFQSFESVCHEAELQLWATRCAIRDENQFHKTQARAAKSTRRTTRCPDRRQNAGSP